MKHTLLASVRPALAVLVFLLATPDPSAAQARNREAGDEGGGTQAVPRNQAPAPAPAPPPPAASPAPPAPPPSPRSQAVGRSTPRSDESSSSSPGSQTSSGARPRGGQPVTGTAVPRGSVPRPRSNTVVVPVYRAYWPWGFSGLGFGSYYGSYYGGYYDPYVYYDPYGPWYGYGQPAYRVADGSLRLKVKPRNAQVFVDGYYVGLVDEFDGIFQRLHLSSGPHRIEVRAPGYEALVFDVLIRFDQTTTFEGELRRIR